MRELMTLILCRDTVCIIFLRFWSFLFGYCTNLVYGVKGEVEIRVE